MEYERKTFLAPWENFLQVLDIEMTHEEIEARFKEYLAKEWPDKDIYEVRIEKDVKCTVLFEPKDKPASFIFL